MAAADEMDIMQWLRSIGQGQLDEILGPAQENEVPDEVDGFIKEYRRIPPPRRHTTGGVEGVLLINDEWGTAKGGISTVNREIACLIASCNMRVYCTSLYESKVDKEDALSKGVELVFPKAGKLIPRLDWLTETYKSYFPHLADFCNVEIVIGHVPITAQVALNIRDDYFKGKKVFLFNHVIPQDTDIHKPAWSPSKVDVKETKILDWVKECQNVFSIGPRIFNQSENMFRFLDVVSHHEYLPMPDQKFFELNFKKPKKGTRVNVLTFGRVLGVENLKGYDIVAAAMSEFAEYLYKSGQCRPIWKIRGIPESEYIDSKSKINGYIHSSNLQLDLRPYGNQDDIRRDITQSHLVIMSSRSEPFGMVGLEAIASAIPVLVTAHSGLAEFLKTFCSDMIEPLILEVGVNDINKEDDVTLMKTHIINMVCSDEKGNDDVFKRAADLKQRLRNCEAIKTSQIQFKSHLAL
ncbi:uncharacterized protein LOC144362053 [Saccoglossus kowalevskii]